jgi:hypothetical protein
MKKLGAGKLEEQAKVRRFVRYDSQSKGYHIYWPEKRSILVECNVVFNKSDTHLWNDPNVVPDSVFANKLNNITDQRKTEKSQNVGEIDPESELELEPKFQLDKSDEVNPERISAPNLIPFTYFAGRKSTCMLQSTIRPTNIQPTT